MTKITLTWQADSEHDEPFDEEVELQTTDLLIPKVESLLIIQEEPETPHKLTDLEGSAINVVLDECIQQLSIIKFLLNENVNPSWNDIFKYQSISERFQPSPKKRQQFQEEVYEKIPYSDHQKLQKDICFILTTLNELCREVAEEGDYTVILDVLEGVKKEEEDNEAIETQKLEHEAELERLNKMLAKEKKELNKALREASDCISGLKNELEDVYAYGKQEVRYTVDWENARTFQNEARLTQQEDVHNNIISNNLINIEYENRIHNEIRNFIEENSEDLQNAINYWMQQYEDEVERRDSEIIRLKMIWEELAEAHIALSARYEERTAFIIEWRQINEDRRIAAELFKIQTAAAIKIQAWWRGTMVRKKLGPFRKKKKGKGKDKGKGKGKGKGGKKKK